ncbi:hypothetical protein PLESTB_001361200 [Pleodorina starrii]|uniref:Uncharacterized protein n=1 Tax=Pleodorina starrii TaxID=330485 RepID=A0A9W6BU64_9CHLO|nr:hypothetical protein PLESTM_002066500 [Pleodorina starrii]GLC58459.1 hypothetical protein PLESTB_001361200 [Pleodorina starrii]GLC77436.1 hypothetical protein PLESTF_001935900 [Pleodorina starrii]
MRSQEQALLTTTLQLGLGDARRDSLCSQQRLHVNSEDRARVHDQGLFCASALLVQAFGRSAAMWGPSPPTRRRLAAGKSSVRGGSDNSPQGGGNHGSEGGLVQHYEAL